MPRLPRFSERMFGSRSKRLGTSSGAAEQNESDVGETSMQSTHSAYSSSQSHSTITTTPVSTPQSSNTSSSSNSYSRNNRSLPSLTSMLDQWRPLTPASSNQSSMLSSHCGCTELAGMMGVDNGHRGRANSASTSHGSNTDDPLEGAVAARSRSRDMLREVSGGASSIGHSSSAPQHERGMVYPLIKVRPEYSTIYRKDPTGVQGKQNVVCVLSVEVPSRRPPPTAEEEEEQHRQLARHYASLNNGLDSIEDAEDQLDGDDEITYDSNGVVQAAPSSTGPHTTQPSEGDSDDVPNSPQRDGSPDHVRKLARPVTPDAPPPPLPASSPSDDEGFSFGATPAAGPFKADDPFKPVFEDLKSRIIDWKGHSIERFGSLQLYDYLGVRQDDIVRDFYVYLFHEALLCVAEERKKEKGLSRFMSAPDKSPAGETSRSPMIGGSSSNKPPLKLKGRIWLRHIRRVQDTSSEGDLSLSVKLDDESLNHFVLCFKDRNTLETWRGKLVELVDLHKPPEPAATPPSEPCTPARSAPPPALAVTPGSVSRRGTTASNASGKAGFTAPALAPAAPITPKANAPQNRDSMHVMSRSGSQGITPALHQQWSASGGLDPSLPPPELLPHTSIDLVIMVSVPYVPAQNPAGGSVSSSAALKLRLIRSTLDFVVAHLGPKDRLALVAYSVGSEGEVRRTALLSASKERSRAKLEQFVECIGQPWMGEGEDPFRESLERLGGSTDRTDTITAVNVGLDIVLQRKSRNPITGMLLINDTADAPRRGQMDLVMARAEAANVPIHSFGFGKSHDPSSLWLISNHTRGSYTFVREWYQLRECIAGCIGSLMSIALMELRLHISVPSDNHFRVRKVAGPTGAIVSASGKDVDIELGELRYGDSKELLVELEFDFNALVPFITEDAPGGGQNVRKLAGAAYEQGSATDDFMQRLGLQGLNLSDVDAEQFAGVAPENLIEEVAVFSVDAGFKDPAINVSTSRLPDPCVLTLEVDAKSPDPMAGASVAAGGAAAALADPVVTRRRIEILVSDMITRSLLVVSRKNHAQALQILTETRRIVDTVLQATPLPALQQRGAGRRLSTVSSVAHGSMSSGGSAARSGPRRQREALHRRTADSLLAIIEDLDMLIDGLEQSRSSFDRDGRNSGAQQAMILRDQRAWTSRTDTEWLRFAHAGDNGPAFTARAAVYASLGGH